MKSRKYAYFTRNEERWNAWTHFGGLVVGIAIGILLLGKAGRSGESLQLFSVGLYLAGMWSCYIASTLYHRARYRSPAKPLLRRFDHAAIYWHIAGSYAPITLVAMQPTPVWGWSLFAFVWAAALAGTLVSFRGLKKHSHTETLCFILMGLSVLVAFKPLLTCMDWSTLGWIVAEGVSYVAGALFYSFPSRRYMHAVFHFFVLLGTACHVVAVWRMIG